MAVIKCKMCGGDKDSQKRAEWCRNKAIEIEKDRIEKQKQSEQAFAWKKRGLCAHCGGSFAGLFAKKCTQCGKSKNY